MVLLIPTTKGQQVVPKKPLNSVHFFYHSFYGKVLGMMNMINF
ncbi:hypothetical protein RG47T_3843 [Mucilaginibacter polytrichastri]|uniref:Uncharacterized protein n=1 Tax=Mucilaginibacter polytrichastri TaxID=1302689 RepID=A0A1Q6A2Y3_9SPHI|nr:hypothetical protein RG47T_3843 [Mucilaginibacter polytrichastri]